MRRQRLFRAFLAACATATTLTIPIVASPPSPALAYIPATSNVNQPIPSGQPVNSKGPMRPIAIDVLDQGSIVDVDVAIRVQHPVSKDLSFYITHPDGTRVELTSANGGGLNYGSGSETCTGNLTVFDDEAATPVTAGNSPFAGSYKPEMILGVMDTLPAAGRWMLEGSDSTDAGVGAVKCIELRFTLNTGNTVAVTTTSDVVSATDGLVSLREAFEIASGDRAGTNITLAANSTYALTCGRADESDDNTNLTDDLDLYNVTGEQLTIDGNGSTITTADCARDRAIDVNGVDTVTLRNLTLVGGRGRGYGGALGVHRATTVTLDHVTVTGANTTEQRGCTFQCTALGAVTLDGIATVRITDSVISANTSTQSSCTKQCYATGALHIVASAGVTLERSVLAGNSAEISSTCVETCIALAAATRIDAGFTVLIGTSITSNRAVTAVDPCQACAAAGGVVLNSNESSVFTSSTISANSAVSKTAQGGGVLRLNGALTLVGTTIVDNAAADGANLWFANTQLFTTSASVIGSTAGPSGCSLGLAPVSAINSFDSADGCRLPTDKGSIINGGDPRLLPLAGTIPVRVPDRGSPLIDRVPIGFCPGPLDQLGTRRPIGRLCDIGAIEAPTDADRPDAEPTDATKFIPLSPARVFDTRDDQPAPGPKGLVPADGTIDVQVTGVAGVPTSNVAAVVLNVTATGSVGAGFVTVWPAGSPRPLASSLNLTAADQDRPNLVTVPVSADGRISLYTQSGTHLLADIAGFYVRTVGPQADGRLVALTPTRVFDTRPGEPAAGPKGRLGRGDTVTAQIAGVAGVPVTGVSAVVLNLTATDALGAGFVTAWPTGTLQPLASVLNVNGAGDTAPNLVMIPLGTNGTISLFSSSGAHLLADVTGYVTDSSAPTGTTGLFVPLSPTRVFDTRAGEPASGPKGRVAANGTITTAFGGVAGIPANASAVMLNLTAAGADSAGFVTTWPTGQERPLASTLNVIAGDTRPNAAIMPLPATGQLDHYSQPATDLLADATGYYLP